MLPTACEIIKTRILFTESDISKSIRSKIFFNTIKKNLNREAISFIVPGYVEGVFAIIEEISVYIKRKVTVLSRERIKEFEAINWSVDCAEIIKPATSAEKEHSMLH